MKNFELSLEQLMKIKGSISSGVSAITFPVTDPKTGQTNFFTARSVTESVSAFLSDVQSNVGELLVSGNKAIPGIRTINDNMLPSGVTQLVYAIRVKADTTLASTTDAAIKAALFASTAPATFLNSDLTITQGQVVLRTAGDDVHNAKAATSNDDDFKSIAPFVLRPQLTISVKSSLAGTAGANHAIKLQWRAIEIVPATNA